MAKLRTAIIGTGKVGHFHARALVNLENSEFVAVAGRILEQVAEFAREYGVKGYLDVAEMVREEKIDVVSICTPHPVHRNVAMAAIENGAHVLVEKPLASNLTDADAILNAAEAAGVTVGTVCQRRFYRPCMRIREAIDSGKIGKPVIGNVHMLGWRDQAYYESDAWRGTWDGEGGGVLVNQAPHQLDLLLWYMGEAEEVYGQWRNFNHPYIEVEDTAVATVKFKSGGIATILVSNSQNPALFGKVQIHGDNGATVGVQTDGGAMFIAGMSTITEAPYNDYWTVAGEEELQPEYRKADEEEFFSVDSMYHYHQLQIADFLDAVSEGRTPMVDGEAGRATVQLIEAIYESTRTGLPVKLEPRK